MHASQRNHPPEGGPREPPFYSLSRYFQRRFGRRVWKISVDAGLDCPNRDGTLAREGCIFCDARSFSPSRRLGSGLPVSEQIAEGKSRIRRRYGASADAFIAYFQPATNTYGPVTQLLPLWQEAIDQPGIVGLAVGTRPDSVGSEVLDALRDLARRTWVSIELGLQSVHQPSLDWLGRGHDFRCFENAVIQAHKRGLQVGAHLMLGLPNESPKQMAETAVEMARLEVDSVKLHNLYIVRDTRLATLWARGEIQLPGQDDYAGFVVDFIERLPPSCVIDRLVGDAPPQYLLAPEWCRHKAAVRRAVEAEFARRGTRQGTRWRAKSGPRC